MAEPLPIVLVPGLLTSPRLYAEQLPALWQHGLVTRMSRSPWNFGGGPAGDQAASSLVGVTVAIVASRAARRVGRCR